MSELATIVQENLKVNIAIINNGFLGMVRQWQEFFYERNYQATPLLNPDFAKLADAYGIRSATVTQRSEVVPTVRDARQHDGPMTSRKNVPSTRVASEFTLPGFGTSTR